MAIGFVCSPRYVTLANGCGSLRVFDANASFDIAAGTPIEAYENAANASKINAPFIGIITHDGKRRQFTQS